MVFDGVNSCKWDAENRLIEIDYPGSGNKSVFTFDAMDRNVQIQEYASGPLTGTKQFIWSGFTRSEERNASSAVTRQFFKRGQTIGGTSYFYTKDHLDSVRELTDASGGIQAEYSFDPFGRVSKQGTLDADMQFSELYRHQPSGLDLGLFRAYSSSLARWLTRDPLLERASQNLYAYTYNNPVIYTDALGLDGILKICAIPGGPESNPHCSGPGHAWIEWQPSDSNTSPKFAGGTYSTWGAGGGGSSGSLFGTGGSMQTGLDGGFSHSNLFGTNPLMTCRTKYISDSQEEALNSVLQKAKDAGNNAWSCGHPCTGFAADAWKAATGESLAGNPVPAALEGSIFLQNFMDNPARLFTGIGGSGQ